MSPTDVVLKMAQRWNDGDIEGMLEMYHEDVVMTGWKPCS
jgi:ketosteroid isomerase-like protein